MTPTGNLIWWVTVQLKETVQEILPYTVAGHIVVHSMFPGIEHMQYISWPLGIFYT